LKCKNKWAIPEFVFRELARSKQGYHYKVQQLRDAHFTWGEKEFKLCLVSLQNALNVSVDSQSSVIVEIHKADI
jgi:hypothetical protein